MKYYVELISGSIVPLCSQLIKHHNLRSYVDLFNQLVEKNIKTECLKVNKGKVWAIYTEHTVPYNASEFQDDCPELWEPDRDKNNIALFKERYQLYTRIGFHSAANYWQNKYLEASCDPDDLIPYENWEGSLEEMRYVNERNEEAESSWYG